MAALMQKQESAFYPEAKQLALEFDALKAMGISPCLTGDPGVGKSYFAVVYAESRRKLVLGQSFFQANITKSSDPRTLLGKMLVHGNGSISMEWQDGDLTLAIKAGGLFLADELNRGAGELQNRFFSLTETGYRYLTLFEKGNEIIEIPKDFMLVATQNPPNAKFYNAPLDRALSERFVHYNIDKPLADEAKLAELLLPNDKRMAETAYNITQDSRKNAQPIGMSTRSLSQVCKLISGGFRPMQAFNVAWINRFDELIEQQAAKELLSVHFTEALERTTLEDATMF